MNISIFELKNINIFSFIVFLLIRFGACYEATYPIEGRLFLHDRTSASNLKVSMNGGEYVTYTKADGTFNFHDVLPGIYLLDVLSPHHYFSQVKVNLPSSPADRIRCLEYHYPGANKQSLSYPIVLTAHGPTWYFEKREEFGIQTLLKNPMMFMVIITLGMIVVFPKMMKNMDPEMMKEMQEQMEKSPNVGNLFSGMLGNPEEKKPAQVPATNKESKDSHSKNSKKMK